MWTIPLTVKARTKWQEMYNLKHGHKDNFDLQVFFFNLQYRSKSYSNVMGWITIGWIFERVYWKRANHLVQNLTNKQDRDMIK